MILKFYFNSSAKLKSPRAIATLPMLNSKMYAVWSPTMIHVVMRSKHMGLDNILEAYSQSFLGMSSAAIALYKANGGIHNIKTVAQAAALKGQPLAEMNLTALSYLADTMNGIGKGNSNGNNGKLDIPNVYLWLRRHGTMAVCEALYGRTGNPMREDPSLLDAFWAYDENLPSLLPGFMPEIFAKTAHRNLTKLRAALAQYYGSRNDQKQEASGVIRVSAAEKRQLGLSVEDLANLDFRLMYAAITNGVPTLYWLFVNIWMRPEVVEEIRREVLPIVATGYDTDGGCRKASVDIARLADECPFLVSCYQETIRLGSQGTGVREVSEDTVFTDDDGSSYLLKKGVQVMWATTTLHRSQSLWNNADEFVPDRFVADETRSDKEEKGRKQGYIPFGGGKHYCPGKDFAFANILGFVSALTLGFDFTGLSKDAVKPGRSRICDSIVKPPSRGEGVSMTIQRREGWENVEWSFRS